MVGKRRTVRFLAGIFFVVHAFTVSAEPDRPILKKIVFFSKGKINRKALKENMNQKESGLFRKEFFHREYKNADSLSILRTLQDEGFTRAVIDSIRFDTADRGKIVESIYLTEGPRTVMKDILFVGRDKISAFELKSAMYQEERRWLDALLFRKKGFNPEYIKLDSASLLATYQNRGFLDASIDSIRIREKKNNHIVEEIYISERTRYKISAIRIEGNRFFKTEDLRAEMEIRKDDYFNMIKINNSQMAIAQEYSNMGFLDARLEFRYTKEPQHTVRLEFIITEKERLRIHSVVIEGNTKIKTKHIRNAFHVENGDWIYYNRFLRGQKMLYETGLFNSVSLMFDSTARADRRKVRIQVREQKPHSFEVGGGYATHDGLRTSAGLNIGSIRRSVSNLNLAGQYNNNSEDQALRAETRYTIPWIRKSRFGWNLGLGGIWGKQDSTASKIETGVFRPLGDYSKFDMSYRFSFGNLDSSDASTYNGAIKPSFIIDTRNDLFQPRKGNVFIIHSMFAAPYTFSEYNYIKAVAEYRHYLSRSLSRVYAGRIKFGLIKPITTAPVSEYFHEGGDQSVRGFDRDSLAANQGSAGAVISNVEIRQRLFRSFGLATFADVGMISAHSGLTDFQNYAGAGIGLRYIFSLGVIRLDTAVPIVDPAGNKKNMKFYFAIGHCF